MEMGVHVYKEVNKQKDPRHLKKKAITFGYARTERDDLFWSIKHYQPTQEKGNSIECVSLGAFLTTSIQVPAVMMFRGHAYLKSLTGLSKSEKTHHRRLTNGVVASDKRTMNM